MKKVYYSTTELQKSFLRIMRQLQKDKWVPDYIVGINRGGLIAGVWASHWLNVPHYPLNVCLRDFKYIESNIRMAKDAFGYTDENRNGYLENCKNILLFDDINDSGHTLEWILDDWQKHCMPGSDRWKAVWGQNVRTAVLIDNLASEWQVNYCGIEINKEKNPEWCVFPWEEIF